MSDNLENIHEVIKEKKSVFFRDLSQIQNKAFIENKVGLIKRRDSTLKHVVAQNQSSKKRNTMFDTVTKSVNQDDINEMSKLSMNIIQEEQLLNNESNDTGTIKKDFKKQLTASNVLIKNTSTKKTKKKKPKMKDFEFDVNNYTSAINLLKREDKTRDETFKLVNYFSINKCNFMEMMKNNNEHWEDLAFNLCSSMQYHYVAKNTVLFKTGDPGEYFFVILKGSMSVVLPEPCYLDLTEEEYLYYLVKLKVNNEKNVFNRVIHSEVNKNILNLDGTNFEKYLLDNYNFIKHTFKLRIGFVVNPNLVDMIRDFIANNLRNNSMFGVIEEMNDDGTKKNTVCLADEIGDSVVNDFLNMFKKKDEKKSSENVNKDLKIQEDIKDSSKIANESKNHNHIDNHVNHPNNNHNNINSNIESKEKLKDKHTNETHNDVNLNKDNINELNKKKNENNENNKEPEEVENGLSIFKSILEGKDNINEIYKKNHLNSNINLEDINKAVNNVRASSSQQKNSVKKSLMKGILKSFTYGNKNIKKYSFMNSVETYIKNNNPQTYIQNDIHKSNNKKLYKSWVLTYVFKINLKEGDKFGEVALDDLDGVRKATIISSEESHLGYLPKSTYASCIKDSLDKLQKANIALILNSNLFEKYNKQYFQNKFFRLFTLEKKTLGEYICREKQPFERIIFIKNGELEISFKKSINEINKFIKTLNIPLLQEENLSRMKNLNKKLIKHLEKIKDSNNDNTNIEMQMIKNQLKRKFHFMTHLKDKEKEIYDKIYFEKDFEKIFEDKYTIRLEIIKRNFIIGVEEFITNSNVLYDIRCISKDCEYYVLTKNSYINSFYVKPNNQEQILNIYTRKKIALENYLVNYKNNIINNFLDKYLKLNTNDDENKKQISTALIGRIPNKKRKLKDTNLVIFKSKKFEFFNDEKNIANIIKNNNEKEILKIEGKETKILKENENAQISENKAKAFSKRKNGDNIILNNSLTYSIKVRNANLTNIKHVKDNIDNFKSIKSFSPIINSNSNQNKSSNKNIYIDENLTTKETINAAKEIYTMTESNRNNFNTKDIESINNFNDYLGKTISTFNSNLKGRKKKKIGLNELLNLTKHSTIKSIIPLITMRSGNSKNDTVKNPLMTPYPEYIHPKSRPNTSVFDKNKSNNIIDNSKKRNQHNFNTKNDNFKYENNEITDEMLKFSENNTLLKINEMISSNDVMRLATNEIEMKVKKPSNFKLNNTKLKEMNLEMINQKIPSNNTDVNLNLKTIIGKSIKLESHPNLYSFRNNLNFKKDILKPYTNNSEDKKQKSLFNELVVNNYVITEVNPLNKSKMKFEKINYRKNDCLYYENMSIMKKNKFLDEIYQKEKQFNALFIGKN